MGAAPSPTDASRIRALISVLTVVIRPDISFRLAPVLSASRMTRLSPPRTTPEMTTAAMDAARAMTTAARMAVETRAYADAADAEADADADAFVMSRADAPRIVCDEWLHGPRKLFYTKWILMRVCAVSWMGERTHS